MKTFLFNTVEQLPEKFSLDQLIDKLIVIEKVEKGLEQSKRGEINTKEQAKKKLAKWLK